MKSTFWIIALVAFGILDSTCHDKVDECICKDNEVCIHDAYTGTTECYLKGSVYQLGGLVVNARNLYVGITNSNQCIDTLIFYNDTTRALDGERFGMIVDILPQGVQEVMGASPPFQVSENEFYSSSVTPLCYLNGEGWFANLHFIVYPDSVWMKLGFWTLNTEPGVFIDSSTVTFYKEY